MNIKNSTRYFGASFILLILIISVIFFWVSDRVKFSVGRVLLVDNIEKNINGLQTASHEVMMYKDEERPRTEWLLKYDLIIKILSDSGLGEEYPILLENHKDLKKNFDELVEFYDKNLGSKEGFLFKEKERQINNKIIYRSQKDVGLAAGIGYTSLLDVEKAIKKGFFLNLAIMAVLAVFLLFVLRYIFNYILNPIFSIKKGLLIVGSGDLNYKLRINLKNEIGDLAQSFDGMTSRLKDLITSRSKLIEEKLEFEKKARNDLEKFKLAADNSNEHIIITDPDGIIVYTNKICEDITGYSPSEVIGNRSSDGLWGGQMDKSFYEKMWHTVKTEKKNFLSELKNKRKNGEIYDASLSIYPIVDEDKVVFFVGVQRDITAEKKIDRMKTEFVMIASHQLRTPLTTIKLFTELLSDESNGKLNGLQKDYLNELSESIARMADLVNNILNISLLESGRLNIKSQMVQYESFVEEILTEIRPLVGVKGCGLFFKAPKEKLPKIMIDQGLMGQVIDNLITNAVRYSPDDRCNIEVELKKEEDGYLLSVKDEGIGIPKSDQANVFKKFFRADNAVSKIAEGNGLGLYFAKLVVETSGGQIWLKSEEGKGTTFYVKIPLSGMLEGKIEKKFDIKNNKIDFI